MATEDPKVPNFNEHGYSVIPPSGFYQDKWPDNSVITQGFRGALSVAGWTSGNIDGSPSGLTNEGYPQQTFLGASLRSFNVNAGFGDSSSTMGVELINDEFNVSDGFGEGDGDDPYHNGKHDKFNPPVVGAPVFFKFGKNFATIEQAFRKDFDQTYLDENGNPFDTLKIPADPFPIVQRPLPIKEHPPGHFLMKKDLANQVGEWVDKSVLTDPNTNWRGFAHFTFGGILQSYTENRSSAGNPLYSVKLTDPREILTNTQLILNNYQGTTFNNKNLFNVYGFLEYDPSDSMVEQLTTKASRIEKLTKTITDQGEVSYSGIDAYFFDDSPQEIISYGPAGPEQDPTVAEISGLFPITGQGFSRRSENGMPWYRVEQAMKAMFGYDCDFPKEYTDAGFGGTIDFRGYNYVVDWGGIPTEEIPKTYYLNFDKLSMMELAQELCDVLSRDLFVSLLPVIDHPACKHLFKKNQEVLAKAQALPEDSPERSLILGSGLTCGIIRIDSIDKKDQPVYGSVKSYLDDLEDNGIFVESRDVGFEVSNVTTDRFVVGAQEVDMHYFNGLRDRDNYFQRMIDDGDEDGKARLEQLSHDKWTLETNQNQQILPFYGFIGDKAVTIPRGFGSYQQILLDAKELDAHGVGAYYVTTEMELRAASVGYKSWSKFLQTYNELYIQELTESMAFYAQLTMNMTEEVAGLNDQFEDGSPIKEQLNSLNNRNFGVAVPRSVWNSDKNNERETYTEQVEETDENGESQSVDVEVTIGGPFEGKMGKDGYPASPCNPPYGYPLYYKRAEKIGIPECGIAQVMQAQTTVLTNIERLEDMRQSDKQRFSYNKSVADNSIIRLRELIKEKKKQQALTADAAPERAAIYARDIQILNDRIEKIQSNLEQEREDLKTFAENKKGQIHQLKESIRNQKGIIKNLNKTSREHLKNARKIHSFLKKIADDNLGKKFLVKIPRGCNVNWSPTIRQKDGKPWDVIKGPFGFKPQPVSTDPSFQSSEDSGWKENLNKMKKMAKTVERDGPTPNDLEGSIWPQKSNIHWHYLDVDAMGQEAARTDSQILTHYGSGYTYGALKSNYNPMSEKWEHNYEPAPQGGFFNYALYDKNLKKNETKLSGISDTKLPKATRQVLAPQLLDKIVSDSNRIQCYVRYDHSQHLDMSKAGTQNVEQQIIGKDGTIIPDVMETAANLHPEKKLVLDQIEARIKDDEELERQGPSVAFVKCTLDERFYMSPKTLRGDATVWAEDFTVSLAPSPYEIVYVDAETLPEEELKEYGEEDWTGCKLPREVKRRPTPVFGVKDGGLLTGDGESAIERQDDEGNPIPVDPDDPEAGNETDPVTPKDANKVPWDDFVREYSETYKSWVIKTEEQDLDPKHVYALITVPGRIIPTQDKRYVDGPLRAQNGHKISNILTEDVVKIDEFKKPGIENEPDAVVDCADLPSGVEFSFDDISKAVQAQKDVVKGISLSNNGDSSLLAYTSPSPVYPDLVALPLMSLERCYGPWLSSALDKKMIDGTDIRFGDIGGKIEFEKDESIAPWSYAGYQLMDEAAKLKTKFANSLLLLTERGSFSYPSAPIDISLAKALKDKGPLVTSISVNVSNNNIKTSVRLDLYTSQFGKLQKQKEIAIAQISRERQKIIDQNNALKRRGMGKGGADMDLVGSVMQRGGQALIDAAKGSSEIFTAFERGETEKASMITISANNQTQTHTKNGNEESILSENHESVAQNESMIQEAASIFRDELEFQDAMDKTAGSNMADIFHGFSDDPFNKYFASRRPDIQGKQNRRTFG
tara:strand:- start:6056 stop:11392 length:5337 start_codon:yes stop_codon:yes gene_type:complete